MHSPATPKRDEETITITSGDDVQKNDVADTRSPLLSARTAVIIGSEFCERFCFYGLKAVLPIFLTTAPILLSDNSATVIIHGFNAAAYTATLLGALLADNWLGRYRTIMALSAVYVVGAAALAASAVMATTTSKAAVVADGLTRVFMGSSARPGVLTVFFIALSLIALGTGGIKPCVSSFGGDQIPKGQTKARESFFSAFYFSVNVGSFVSMLMTPVLSRKISCLGNTTCYPAAFGVPAVLMALALAVFWLGRFWYTRESMARPGRDGTASNVVSRFMGYLGARMHVPYCKMTTDADFAASCAKTLRLFVLFVPIMFFWALFDQQGSGWVFQAVLMDPVVRLPFGISFTVLPEQMQVVNALLILVFIPLFDRGFYPLYQRVFGRPMRETARMLAGLALAIVAFAMAAGLQYAIVARGTFATSGTTGERCVSGCIPIVYQLPQYVVLTAAEILVSITGLSYGFAAAPAELKTVVQAGWLLTVAGGNLVVVIVTALNPIGLVLGKGLAQRMLQAHEFSLWTVIIAAATILFFFVARSYEGYLSRNGY